MGKYPCLVLDHDDTLVQSESTVNYPAFLKALEALRPGHRIAPGLLPLDLSGGLY